MSQGLGSNGWAKPAPPGGRPSFTLAPPVIQPKGSPDVEPETQPTVTELTETEAVEPVKQLPPVELVEPARVQYNAAAITKKPVAKKKKVGKDFADSLVRVSIYIGSASLERARSQAISDGTFMNVLIADRASGRGDEVHAMFGPQSSRKGRRRRLERVVDPVRWVFTLTMEEIKDIDALAMRCGVSRSSMVRHLIELP